MTEPRTQKGARSKRGFLNSAAELFNREGFNNCSIDSICVEAKLPVGSFYRYFANKEDLLIGIVQLLQRELFEKLQNLPSGQTSIAALFQTLFDFVENHAPFYQACREAEFVHGDVVRSFYEGLAGMVAAKLPFSLSQEEREIVAYEILGIQSFFTMKFQLWEKKKISLRVIQEISALVEQGISSSPRLNLDQLITKAEQNNVVRLERFSSRTRDPREKLLRSAEKVFGTEGFRKAAVADIAKGAGISVGAFYNTFENKEEAFRQTILRFRERLVEHATQAAEGSSSRLETEVRSLLAFLSFIKKNPLGYRIMREAEFIEFPLARDYYGYLFQNYSRRLRETAKSGEFASNDFETMALAMMGIGHLFGLRYSVWEKGSLAPGLQKKLVHHVFLGIKKRTTK